MYFMVTEVVMMLMNIDKPDLQEYLVAVVALEGVVTVDTVVGPVCLP